MLFFKKKRNKVSVARAITNKSIDKKSNELFELAYNIVIEAGLQCKKEVWIGLNEEEAPYAKEISKRLKKEGFYTKIYYREVVKLRIRW